MTGANDKKRFSVKLPDGDVYHGEIWRYGTHNPKEDERSDLAIEGGRAVLLRYPIESYDLPVKHKIVLPEGTLAANGYYDHEHDGWKTVKEFLGL